MKPWPLIVEIRGQRGAGQGLSAQRRSGTYPVREQAVAGTDSGARSVRDTVPAIRLLRKRASDIMVPVEGQERGELHPPVAQLLVRVSLEPARVRADERDLVQLELQHPLDAEVHVLPLAYVVPKPVPRPFARAGERGATDHERPLPGVDVEQRAVRRLLFHQPPHVVDVELHQAVRVRGIRRHGVRG